MLHCSVCKSVLKPTDIFCGNCGTKNDGFEKEQNVEVRTRSACISCKRSIAAADLFCGNCGTKNTAFENCTTVSKEAIPTQDFALPPQSTDDKMEATIPTLQIFESPIQETQSDALTSQCDAASQNDTLEKETAQPQQEDGLYKDICAQIATLASDIEVLQGGNALEQVVARMDGLDTTVDRLTPKIDSLENNLGTIADGITLLDSNLTRLQVELVPTVQDLSQSVVAQKEIFANESVALTNVLSATIALNNHTEQIKNDLGNQFSELHILKEELNAQFLQIKSEVDTIHATTNDFAKNTQGQMVASLQQTQTQTTESVQQCTSTILEDLQKVKDSQKHLVDTIRILDENIQAVKTSQEKFNKKASAGWVFFALCFPLIAAIVYLANVRQNPQRAKMLGLGIFISLLLTLCVVIAGVVLLLLNQYNILTLPWIPILPGHKI